MPDTNYIIAKCEEDGDGYSASGVVFYINDNGKVSFHRYSHCSCYGTEDGMKGADWEKDIDEVYQLAIHKADPDMPERTMDKGDYDNESMMELYSEYITWYNRLRQSDHDELMYSSRECRA